MTSSPSPSSPSPTPSPSPTKPTLRLSEPAVRTTALQLDFVRLTDLTVGGVEVITDSGYRIEAAVPWERLNVTSPKRGLLLTMNLTVSDGNADTAGLRTMVSNNPVRTRNDATGRYRWGQLTLK